MSAAITLESGISVLAEELLYYAGAWTYTRILESKWVTGRLFGAEYGDFKANGIMHFNKFHVHLGFGSESLMRHHLPWEYSTWKNHALAKYYESKYMLNESINSYFLYNKP